MNWETLEQWRKRFSLTQNQFAKMLGITLRGYHGWADKMTIGVTNEYAALAVISVLLNDERNKLDEEIASVQMSMSRLHDEQLKRNDP